MATPYNQIAVRSVERIEALSDGLFAIAMTLLVLDLKVPATEAIHSERDLWGALVALSPRLLMYLMSFLTLGIFWAGQQTQLNYFARADRDLSWIHIAFLAAIALMPFSTTLLAEHVASRIALLVYWANVLLPGLLIYASWIYATRAGLLKDDVTPEISAALKRRVLIAQSLYAFGALLCVVNTYWSIGFIFLVQLNFAVAPRLPKRWRR